MQDTLSTRFSLSFALPVDFETGAKPCHMIRIHPVVGISKPVELSSRSWILGRDVNSDIVLDDDSVSRRHAILEPVPGGFQISDLGSTNGTFVNDQKITRVRLNTDDRIRLGKQIFKFLESDAVESQYFEVVYQMMTTDGLTRVHNKRYLLETLEREISHARRKNQNIAVMMLDIDHFKSINDTHGHLVGDRVLAEFARRVQSQLRGGELLARYGGEEFSVAMLDASLQDALQAANRILEVVRAKPFDCESVSVPVTVSIGVAEYRGDRLTHAANLLDGADQMLYQAKQSGRNRVCS